MPVLPLSHLSAHTCALLALCAGATATLAQNRPADLRAKPDSGLVWRTYVSLHEHPELGKQEHHARELIRASLVRMGYTTFVESKLAPTAVVAVLETGRPGPVIALRAEMDARPSQEPESHRPRSLLPGVMHNCGHDAHAAMLLGVADMLKRDPSLVRGKIVFVFQPAEETKGGADDLVNEGVLRDLGVTAIFAQHAVAGMPVGKVSASPGPTMAGSAYFTLRVTGRQSHAADPSSGDDVLLAASELVRGLAQYPARRFDIASRPVVISTTFFSSGLESATNVLSGDAIAKGTIRAFERITFAAPPDSSLAAALNRYVASSSEGLRVKSSLEILPGSPPTVNDTALFGRIAPKLAVHLGTRFDTTPFRGMFSEDFAYYTESIPAIYFGWGIARDGLGGAGVHSPEFTIHPSALIEGVRFLALLAQVATQ